MREIFTAAEVLRNYNAQKSDLDCKCCNDRTIWYNFLAIFMPLLTIDYKMEEQYTKDFLVADFTNQVQVTEENILKLRDEIARQTQQLVDSMVLSRS